MAVLTSATSGGRALAGRRSWLGSRLPAVLAEAGRAETVLRIEAADCRLGSAESRWLEETIRARYRNEAGPLDACAHACLELADVLAAKQARTFSDAPFRLGYAHVQGLCGDILHDDLIRGNERLATLYRALRRYRGEPV